MRAIKKQNNEWIRYPLIGVGISVLVMLCLLVFVAWLLDREKMDTDQIGIAAYAVQFVSALCGSVFAARGERGLAKGLLMGIGYLLMLVCVNALFLEGTYSGLLIGAIMVLIASVIPAIINNLPKKRTVRRKRKK